MFYAFIGQLKTTSGKPHSTTGRMNTYGDLKAFDTISERDEFVNNFYDNNPSVSCVKTNKQAAKYLFFGGMTQYCYENEYLRCVDCE